MPDARKLEALFADLHREAARASGTEALTLREWVDLATAWRLVDALHRNGGNRSAAARSLGIGRRTLYAKMERLGVHAVWTAEGSDSSAGDTAHEPGLRAGSPSAP